MRTVIQHTPEFSGMALGGIGTGTIEIFPTGRLENWSIFNLGKWASRSPKEDGLEDLPGFSGEPLRFYLRTCAEGETPLIRKLSYDSSEREGQFRSAMYSWVKCVPEIAWTPDFPVARLEFCDPDLPVEVSAEYLSPFVPHDSQISGTPGFSICYTVRNRTRKPVTVSILGMLDNPVCRGNDDRKLHNKVEISENTAMLTMSAGNEQPLPENGSITLMAEGGFHSFLRGEFEAYFRAYVLGGAFGVTEESCLFDFRETGVLPDLGWEELPDLSGLDEEQLKTMSSEQIEELLALVLQCAWAAHPWKRLSALNPSPVEDLDGKRKFLTALANQYKRFCTKNTTDSSEWGGGALCSQLTLQAGETAELKFFVGWYFPHHISPTGKFVGHQYANWFADSAQVCQFLYDNEKQIFAKVRSFARLLSETDVPEAFPAGWTAHLNTMIKCSWWAKNGDFGIWEGFGSCGFHTTDITYHGSWGLIALFPELQCRQMRMGAAFQRDDGRVHHFFTPDFSAVDEGFDRVDMNPQFVLMVCRDYLWTGDQTYLNDMWPYVIRAMESTQKLDSDGDGLPDTDTGSNTYDAWRFQGIPAYIAVLWLGALTAAIRLAEERNEEPLREKWTALLEKGKQSFTRLWNGSYYSLWIDGQERDECCMSDQLDGLWYTLLMGLPSFLEEKRVSQALDSILRWNFSGDGGLMNASYPEGTAPTLYTWQNVQAMANWSGVEYAFASLLLENHRFTEARLLAESVEKRYRYAGRTFNQEECGDYYYRPLSSWTMMLSLSGFRLDAARKWLRLSLLPEVRKIPWFSPTGCGKLIRHEGILRLECGEGMLKFRSLLCNGLPKPVKLLQNGTALPLDLAEDGTILSEVCLNAGDILEIYVTAQ